MSFRAQLKRNAVLRRKIVGAQLRAEREKLKKTPEEVAYALGLDRTVLSRIECGRRKLDLIEAENFAVYFGIELGELATWRRQQDADETKVDEGKLYPHVVLDREEFLRRETESIELRKEARTKKKMQRSSLTR